MGKDLLQVLQDGILQFGECDTPVSNLLMDELCLEYEEIEETLWETVGKYTHRYITIKIKDRFFKFHESRELEFMEYYTYFIDSVEEVTNTTKIAIMVEVGGVDSEGVSFLIKEAIDSALEVCGECGHNLEVKVTTTSSESWE